MRRLIITALVAALTVATQAPALAEPVVLTGEESRYPHAIRLEHGPQRGSILLALHGNHVVDVLRANRAAKKFKKVAAFVDTASTHATCCGHLYELPSQVGAMPAGTVLWVGSVGYKEETLKARIWRSPDAGETWEYLSECARAKPQGGLWEPDLSVDANGRLNCYFADESDAAHSQYIGRTVSSDGVNWSAKEKIVAVRPRGYRPGMAQVKRLPTGQYYMMYEICNGRTIFVSENGGRDGWYEVPAPVPGARDNYCPNYHPTAVASLDGTSLIGFASDFAPNGGCRTSWATGSLPPFPG